MSKNIIPLHMDINFIICSEELNFYIICSEESKILSFRNTKKVITNLEVFIEFI